MGRSKKPVSLATSLGFVVTEGMSMNLVWYRMDGCAKIFVERKRMFKKVSMC